MAAHDVKPPFSIPLLLIKRLSKQAGPTALRPLRTPFRGTTSMKHLMRNGERPPFDENPDAGI